jgi:hypothetical protein
LKHQEKPNVSTIVALGFPNGAMSAAFRVAFNDAITTAQQGNGRQVKKPVNNLIIGGDKDFKDKVNQVEVRSLLASMSIFADINNGPEQINIEPTSLYGTYTSLYGTYTIRNQKLNKNSYF